MTARELLRASLTMLALMSVLLASKCVEEGWQHEGTKTYHPGKPGPRGIVPPEGPTR